MLSLLVLLVTVPASFSAPVINDTVLRGSKDPEIWMTCAEVIQRWGYPVEQYDVTTDDGYILTIFRIPRGRYETQSESKSPKPIVFFQHGLESSSYDWVANLPNEAAGFLFADNGFDVWMGNFRGNTYGKGHVKLNSKQKDFWKFSWDEMAEHDLPAMINKVLNITQSSSLFYIGHSMGTMTAFAKLSRDQTFAKKIKTFYALAPVTTVQHIKGPLKMIAPLTKAFDKLASFFGYDEFLPSNEITHLLAQYFCANPVTSLVCDDVAILLCGPESNQLNVTRLPVYVSHLPAGTSTQNIAHFGQGVMNGKFEMYDYGGIGGKFNKQHYGQSTPPVYDLDRVAVPVYLFWGDSDWLADPKDVQNLIPKLRNIAGNVYLRDFNHLDFIWGLRAASEIYWPIIRDIRQQFYASKLENSVNSTSIAH